MTRKHFKAIAAALAESQPTWVRNAQSRIQWEKDCAAMADVCQKFNASFDRPRFMEACNA